MYLPFSTKARTLAALQGVLKSARIAPLHVFSVADWNANQKGCLDCVVKNIGSAPWIVRSSCGGEDGVASSKAGKFLSILNTDMNDLAAAVERVIASYGEAQCTDEVLIQPMLTQVRSSGVAFSHDPNTCAPYRLVNWSEGGDTSVITSGLGGRLWQQAADSIVQPPSTLAPIISGFLVMCH